MRTIPADHGPPEALTRWITELYEAHAPALLRYLTARVGPTAAEDLTAETFVTAIRRHETFDRSRGTTGAWLFGIATNALRDHARREAKYMRTVARLYCEPQNADPEASTAVARVDAGAVVRQLIPDLLNLSDTDRDILLLTSWAGLSPTEIAAALQLNPAVVRTRLHRVRSRLQGRLEASADIAPRRPDANRASVPTAPADDPRPSNRTSGPPAADLKPRKEFSCLEPISISQRTTNIPPPTWTGL